MAAGVIPGPPLDPTVQVAIITAVSGLAVAIVGGIITIITLLIQTKRHAKSADVQVSNNHVDDDGKPINLREESDTRHAELVAIVERVAGQVGTVAGDVRGMKRDWGRMDTRLVQMREEVTETRRRVDQIDDTQQRETIQELREELHNRRDREHGTTENDKG